MKTYVWAGLVAFCGTAAADPLVEDNVPPPPVQTPHGVWLDAGVAFGHLMTLQAELVRFAPHVMISQHLYVGIEADFGHVSGVGISQQPITTGGDPSMQGASIIGSAAIAEAVIGARAFDGQFSGAAELAAGEHALYLTNAMAVGGSNFIGTEYFGVNLEAHGRFDFWVTPRITIGATASLSLQDYRDVNIGLTLGLHGTPYDAAR